MEKMNLECRKQYFKDVLLKMERAADIGLVKLKEVIQSEMKNFVNFPLPLASQIRSTQKIDFNSLELYPKDDELCTGFTPTPIYGDGNCLCRTGSMYVFGTEECHKELRARVVAEMVLNKDWYMGSSSNRLYAQFTERLAQSDNLRLVEGVEAVFDRCILRFTKNSSWGEMWNLMAMCSVLGCTVYSIYPNLNGTQRDRHLFHKRIDPRVRLSTQKLRIMWTNLNLDSFHNKWWMPNHFVACISTEFQDQPNRRKATLGDYFTSFIPSKPKQRKINDSKSTANEHHDNTYTANTRPTIYLDLDTDISKDSQTNEHPNSSDGTDIDINAHTLKPHGPEDVMNTQTNEPLCHKDTQINEPHGSNDGTDIDNDSQTNVHLDSDDSNIQPNTNEDAYTDVFEQQYEIVTENFYKKMGLLALSNERRDVVRSMNPVQTDADNIYVSVERSNENRFKTLASILPSLRKKQLSEVKKEKRAHLFAIVACGEYLIANGPLVKTQELCTILLNSKSQYKGSNPSGIRKRSIELLETLSKYLPVMQIYINGTGYIMEYRKGDIQTFVNNMANSVNLQQAANRNLEESLDNMKDYMDFVDTELDRSIIRSILVKVFSINSVSRLPGTKSKQTLQRSRDEVPVKLRKFSELKHNLLPVRNDMTNKQQHSLHCRLISKYKTKAFKTRAAGAGREKYADKFPQLAEVIELAFGKGSKIHPRLTEETRYKDPNLALTMPKAREILLAAASSKIPNIALSTCYTYTQNFRRNTKQAMRHHAGENVNANISFKKLPRVGMLEEKINAHYCRSNVNYLLETAAANGDDFMVDAKDAKGIVCADIDPVQNIGKSWKDESRLDHQFDQSRTNACTPMTHLFLKTISEHAIKSDNLTVMNITRTGQPVTLINLSFFEPETVFRCFNELFLLLANPALDYIFRNDSTGTLKKNWIFVVDNGPSEAPASCLVRMLLVRLVCFLDLDVATQISFEKLNSKDNPAERPHAAENMVLSRHGPFRTSEIFKNKDARPGSKQHFENMELMAEEVINCIKTAKFGSNSFFCFRGVKEDFLFNDEERLRNFLRLSEQGKDECDEEYSVSPGNLSDEIQNAWKVDLNFSSSYISDYNHLCNSKNDDIRTSWLTEYQATIYSSHNLTNTERFHREPLPDYIRWISSSGELHYMPFEQRRVMPYGEWDNPEMFMPKRLLNYISQISDDVPESVLTALSLFIWITKDQVKDEMSKISKINMKTYENDEIRERWCHHPLFKRTVVELQEVCKEKKIPITSNNTKTDLITSLSNVTGIQPPEFLQYEGDLSGIPADLNGLSNFSVFYLKSILKFHNINFSGTKDELIMKVFLLRHKRSYIFLNMIISKLIKIAEAAVLVIIWQKRNHNFSEKIYRQRKHTNISNTKTVVPVPDFVSQDNLDEVFNPLFEWLDSLIRSQTEIDMNRDIEDDLTYKTDADHYQQCKEPGAKVKVFWNREDIGTSNWKVGWYNARIVSYDASFDVIELEYLKEPGCIYELDFSHSYASRKIKFVSSPYYSK